VGTRCSLGLAAGLVIALAAPSARADVGLMVDAGVPDGATGSLLWRPLDQLRLHAGGSYNGVSPGVRAGLTVSPWQAVVTPSLTLEAGHFFPGDANPMVERFTGADADDPALRDVAYDYVNAHVGLEIGHKRVTFYLRAGMTRAWSRVRNINGSIEASSFDNDGGITVDVRDDPRIRVQAPSAKLGFIIYL